jgi:hypothetical protein
LTLHRRSSHLAGGKELETMRIPSWILISCGVLAGCGTDLGECDSLVAERVVYSPEGVPYYEGQALVRQSCASAFCHTAGATGDQRKGVPHGLDFDVAVLTVQSLESDVIRLRKGVTAIRDEAEEIYSQVESGAMPPGKEGEAARANIAWKAQTAMGSLIDALLPDVASKDGTELLRNWLACGAPVISATSDAPPALLAEATKFGDTGQSLGTLVEPTFESIFANVFEGECRACHISGGPYSNDQSVEFDDLDHAYDSIVGPNAFSGGSCDGRGALIVPGDCEGSLLYQKLLPEGETMNPCGDPMPLGGDPLSADTLAAICEWIDTGADR